jgi:hypothetical protein
MWILLVVHLATGQMTQLEFPGWIGCNETRLNLTISKDEWDDRRKTAAIADENIHAGMNSGASNNEMSIRFTSLNVSEKEVVKTFTDHITHSQIDAVCIPKNGLDGK